MPSGDLCKRSTPRVELDQRARDACLGLERIERLLAQRATDDAGSGRSFIFLVLAHTAKGRRIP
jgi:hypothetical protein